MGRFTGDPRGSHCYSSPAAPAEIIAIHSLPRALAITLPRLLTVHVVRLGTMTIRDI